MNNTKIVEVNDDVYKLIQELKNDLKRQDLVFIERLPPVREYERYRDIILNILKEYHIALVLIRLVFKNGERKGYAILIKGEEGILGQIPNKGIVEGYVVQCKDNERLKVIYKSTKFESPQEIASKVYEFARIYHEAEARIIEMKLPEAYQDFGIFYIA